MSRTIRHRRPYYSRYYPETHRCTRCGKMHITAHWKDNVPECVDGRYYETSMKKYLKDERKMRERAYSKSFLTKFKHTGDIEDVPYLHNRDVMIDWYLT